MIPLRISLEGFMSYRDKTELSFEGASLWMLSGHNGAGKSALFDAITYALYGTHRGGAQNADELINKQSDGLKVEFDFAAGQQIYRIQRTLPHKGRATCQACQYDGSKFKPISKTDSVHELEQWVRDIIGLDERTFTASVLLRQGEGEALLKANPSIRHEMLSQIVDLTDYQKLYQEADRRAKQLADRADNLNIQLQSVPVIEDAELQSLEKQIEAAIAAGEAAQERLHELGGLKVHAKNWAVLRDDQASIERMLAEAQILFSQADQIRGAKARLDELRQVLPLLQDLLNERSRLEQCEQAIFKLEGAVHDWDEQVKQARDILSQLEEHLKRLREREKALQGQQTTALQQQSGLAADLANLKELIRLRLQARTINESLAGFPTDLDQQVQVLETRVAYLIEIQSALPWLREFVAARDRWKQAEMTRSQAKGLLTLIKQQLPKATVEHAATPANMYAEQTQQQYTQTQIRLNDIREHLQRLDVLEGRPTCDYCGQPLTAEHLEIERRKLMQASQEAQESLEEAEQRLIQAKALREQEDKAIHELEQSQSTLDDAETRAKNALQNLPTAYQVRIQPIASVGMFENPYPTAAATQELALEGETFGEQEQRLKNAVQQRAERDRYLAQRETNEPRLQELEVLYPQHREEEIQAAERAACQQLDEARAQLQELHSQLQEHEEKLNQARGELRQREAQQREAYTQYQGEQVHRSVLQRMVSQKVATLPEEWQHIGVTLLPEQLVAYQEEAERLAGVENQYVQLEEAFRHRETRQQRAAVIQQQIRQIPLDAQRPFEELEHEEQQIRQALKEAGENTNSARSKKQELEGQQQQRRSLSKQALDTQHEAHLYKNLAQILGREGLQRYLLEQAETDIVTYANRVLDHISGGSLRLELRREKGQISDAPNKSGTKALDLVAYNSQISSEALLVSSLSGSQRFRVAVSLALGIGQYASQGTRQIESVIIDEGFGSLDKEGRQQMIDELHLLGEVLSRIILVSHEDDFAHAFSTGYEISLKDGTSQVQLFEGV